jgi:hypothetical protein
MNDPKTIWQNQGNERVVVPLGLLRDKLRQLHRKIVLQLAFAAGVGLIALDLFVRGLVRAQYLMDRIGWSVAIAGMLYLLVPALYRHYRIIRQGNLSINAGLTSSLQFYRSTIESCARSGIFNPGTILMFLGLAGLSTRPARRYYELFQQSGFSSLPPWLPIVVLLLVMWAIIAIIVNKKNRVWTQREFQVLETLEKENR